MALSVTGKGLIVGSSNLIEICQRPEGCNLTVTVLGSQLSGICLDHRIGGSSLLFMLNQHTRCQDNILLTQKFRKFLKP
jgi:hypothetical protein